MPSQIKHTHSHQDHCQIRLSDVSQFVALNLNITLNLIDNNGISLKTLQQNHNLFSFTALKYFYILTSRTVVSGQGSLCHKYQHFQLEYQARYLNLGPNFRLSGCKHRLSFCTKKSLLHIRLRTSDLFTSMAHWTRFEMHFFFIW